MALKYGPRPASIIKCDFSMGGFKKPEMIKPRMVVVLSAPTSGLVNVVPLSATAPNVVKPHHCRIDAKYLPNTPEFPVVNECWVKGDMLYSAGYNRLSSIGLGRDSCGKRIYFTGRLNRELMKQVYSCVLNGINMGQLAKYL